MKITVKKGNKTILHRNDATSVNDKGGAYVVIYEDGTGQMIYKDSDLKIEMD